MKTLVSPRKQTSIPATLCREIGIEPGWELDWQLKEGVFEVTPVPPAPELSRRIRERARGWKIFAEQHRGVTEEQRQWERENEEREGRQA